MHMRKAFLLIFLAGLLLAAGYALYQASQPVPVTATTTIDLGTAVSAYATDDLIAFWNGRVRQHPQDPISLAYLGQAYWQKGRETGDAASYGRAQAALEQALTLKPDDELALALLATILLSQHDFQGALTYAQRVYNFDPGALQALATVGDAHLELGHYAEAAAAYHELAENSDHPSVYGRLSRLAWLQGDPQASITHMQQAIAQAESLKLDGEQMAWYYAQLGELYFNTGHLDDAQTQYQRAADTFAHYYLAAAGSGKVYAARGDADAAIALYEPLVATLPQPELVARLGDWYALNGDQTAATKQYDTVSVIAELEAANAILSNRQLALFYANHDSHLDTALALAEKELETRADVYAYDTLAWALYKNGRVQDAAATMERALAQDTQDALLFYHAGMIATAQGKSAEAIDWLQQALAFNPHFDLWQAQIARETLSQLTEEMP